MSNDIALSDKEQLFINNLLENGGNATKAAAAAGYNVGYSSFLRKRLAKEIAEATQQYLAWHGPKAAHKVIDMMDSEMPNPVHLAAAKDILDRAGVKVQDDSAHVNVKANIFILPEKKISANIIDLEPE